MIIIKRVTEFSELEGIQKLQKRNLKANLSLAETETEGFVTAEYTIEFLQKMHEAGASIIAKDDDMVVGYALVASPKVRNEHELLAGLFTAIDKSAFGGKLLKDSDYVVVGQLCVSKQYRGMRIVDQMYEYYRECLSDTFDYCITDIDQANPRSLKVHMRSGFQVINTLQYKEAKWDIVLWDWNKVKK